MKILLQCTNTLHFFNNVNRWTEKPDEALDFPSTTAAADTCRNYGISNARIALIFHNGITNTYLSCFEETVPSVGNLLHH
jgi:hypothetical protein